MANYPASLPSSSPATHQAVLDEIIAIATELSTDPSGTDYTTVKARIAAAQGVGYPASAHGLIAWLHDPMVISGNTGTQFGAGIMYTSRLYVPEAVTITNFEMYIVTAGATLTAGNCRAALYDSSGTLIANTMTADLSTTWNTTGPKTIPLGTPYAAAAGFYDVGWWWNGTTAMAFPRAGNGAGQNNYKLTGLGIRTASTNQTGLTATAPATVGTKTAHAHCAWVGVS